MGVSLQEVKRKIDGSFEPLPSIRFPRGDVADPAPNGWLLDVKANDGYAAVNRLLRRGVEVHRILNPVKVKENNYDTGSWHVVGGAEAKEELEKLSKRYHLVFDAAPKSLVEKPSRMLRIGMYQRLYGGNIEEGWTRWLLEQYRFSYRSLNDKEIKKGKLSTKYDVIIIPSDAKAMILGEGIEEYYEKRFQGQMTFPKWPDEYKSGIGKEGAEKIVEFVNEGGTLIAVGESTEFAIEQMKLPVKNILQDVKSQEFTCPGSTLHVKINRENPLTWGVQDDLLIIFRNSPAFEVKPSNHNEDTSTVLSYPESQIMESGWLFGEEKLSRKAALIEAKKGKGRVILYGFPVNFRAQSDAAFKLLFNALTG
jgi:hypothetical protein